MQSRTLESKCFFNVSKVIYSAQTASERCCFNCGNYHAIVVDDVFTFMVLQGNFVSCQTKVRTLCNIMQFSVASYY